MAWLVAIVIVFIALYQHHKGLIDVADTDQLAFAPILFTIIKL